MATRLYGVNPGVTLDGSVSGTGGVTDGVGSATTSHNIELTVDLANTIVTDASTVSGTRTISRNEVLIALNLFYQYIERQSWPPA